MFKKGIPGLTINVMKCLFWKTACIESMRMSKD